MLTYAHRTRRLTFKKNVLNRNYRAADERFFCTNRYACVQFGAAFSACATLPHGWPLHGK